MSSTYRVGACENPKMCLHPAQSLAARCSHVETSPTFLGNPGLQDTLIDALRDRGAQVLLYGDTGVGKSSLIDIAAEDEKLAKVSISCMSSDTFDSLVDKAIKQMVTVRKSLGRYRRMVRGKSKGPVGYPAS